MANESDKTVPYPDTLGVAAVPGLSAGVAAPVGAGIGLDAPAVGLGGNRDTDLRDDVLTVAEEIAHVGIERRELGGTRVRIVTDHDDVTERVSLRSETVDVTRHPVNREVDAFPETRTEGDVTIIPVVEERAVTITKLFVTEEIHIRRTAQVDEREVPVTLRRQRAVVERLDENGAVSAADAAAD